jgi:hypothetical protein
MWLFEPSSPCIATFNPNTSLMRNLPIHILFALATPSTHVATYHRKGRYSDFITANRGTKSRQSSRRTKMLWTITIILFILWIVGLVSSYTLGGWIHILLVLAIIVLIFNLLSGRRAL